MSTEALGTLVERVARALQARGWMLATAESCTGGLIAAHCTDRAGSSLWFERGFVCYSNAAKSELLGVPEALLETHGAVSEPVAVAMAAGALQRSRAQVSVAVTGIAGPGGATPGKPVGTVWLAWAVRSGSALERAGGHGLEIHSQAQRLQLPGDRQAVRQATVHSALIKVLELAEA